MYIQIKIVECIIMYKETLHASNMRTTFAASPYLQPLENPRWGPLAKLTCNLIRGHGGYLAIVGFGFHQVITGGGHLVDMEKNSPIFDTVDPLPNGRQHRGDPLMADIAMQLLAHG